MDIDPRDIRFWNYLVEHKTPVTAERLAKHFLVSKSHAGRALKIFAEQGLAEVKKNGSTKTYRPTPENRTRLLRIDPAPVEREDGGSVSHPSGESTAGTVLQEADAA